MEDVSQTNEAKEVQPQTESAVEKTQKVPAEEKSAIEQGQAVLDGIKEQKIELEKLVKRQEEVAARMMLGGRSLAGEPAKTSDELEKEKTDAEVNKAVNRFK